MKPKKVLALLLAVMMMVSMIPISASAATPTDNLINVKLSVNKEFGGTFNQYTNKGVEITDGTDEDGTAPLVATTTDDYIAMVDDASTYFGREFSGAGSNKKPATPIATLVANANKAFTPLSEVDGVAPGSTVFIGVKITTDNLGAYNGKTLVGVTSADVKIRYNPNQIKPVDADVIADFKSHIATNALGAATLVGTATDESCTEFTYDNQATTINQGGGADAGYSCIEMPYSIASDKYLSETNTWDFVIPMEVQAGAKGTIEVETVKTFLRSNNDTAQLTVGMGDAEWTAADKTLSVEGFSGGGEGDDHLITNKVSIKIAGPSVAASSKVASGAGERTITLTPGNDKTVFGTGAETTSNYTVEAKDSAGTSAGTSTVAVTGAKKNADGTVTLTINGGSSASNSLVAQEKLAISIKPAAFDTTGDHYQITTDLATDNMVEIAAAPNAAVDYANGQITTTETSDVKLQIKDTTTWSTAFKSGTPYTLTDADLAALKTAGLTDGGTLTDAITVAWADDTSIATKLSVTKAGTPNPLPAIDYTNKQVKNVPATVEWKVGSDSYAAGTTGTVDIVDTAASGKVVFGDTVTYRTKATASALASDEKTLDVPTRPVITKGTATQDPADVLDGKTAVAFTVNPSTITQVKYKVDTNAYAGSDPASDITGGPITTGDTITAAKDKKIDLYVPAGATNFDSEVLAYGDGAGNDWTTLTASDIGNGSGAFKVTAHNGTWGTTSGVTLFFKEESGSSYTDITSQCTVTAASGVLTIAKSSGKFEPGDYEIRNIDGAVTKYGSKAMQSNVAGVTYTASTDGGKLAFNVANKGYKLVFAASNPDRSATTVTGVTPADITLPTGTYQHDAGKTEVTITGLKAYEDIETISADKGTLEYDAASGKFYFTPPTTEVTEPVDVHVTLKTKKKVQNIDVSNLIAYDSGTTAEATYTKDYDADANGAVPSTWSVQFKASYISGLAADDYKTDLGLAATDVTSTGMAFKQTGTDTAAVDAGTTYDVKATGLAIKAGSKAEGYYKLVNGTTETTTAVLKSGSAVISQIAMDHATGSATASSSTDATLEIIRNAIKTADLTPYKDTTNALPVIAHGDLTYTDSALDTAINAALTAAHLDATAVTANHDYAVTGTATMPAIAGLKYGDTITLTGDGYTYAMADTAGLTLTDNVLTLAPSNSGGTISATITATKDGTDYTITISAMSVAASDYTNITGLPTGTKLTVDVKNALGAMTNYSSVTGTANVEVTFNKTGGDFGGGSTGGFGVTLQDKGYGSASSTYVQTDENGKITSLPTVTDVVKGASFAGWSTDGTKKGKVDVGTFIANKDITLYAIYDGYMQGDDNNNIKPTAPVTRAQLVKMLVVAAGLYDPTVDYGAPTFNDVSENAWYAKYLACAQRSGKNIANGYPGGDFKPDEEVTREEAAKFIAATFDLVIDENAKVDELNDFDNLQGWAKGYVAALYNTGAISGYEDGTYRGTKDISRQESAKITNTFLGLTDEAREQIKNDPEINASFNDMVSKNDWAYADLIFASLNAPADYYSTQLVIPER